MTTGSRDHRPDALTRVAAGVVVPVVAVGAHGLGAGEMPAPAGMLLTAAIGALVAYVVGGQQARTAGRATVHAAAVLTLAQIGAHLSMGIGHSGMHHDGFAPMVFTHLVAIPLSAVLIVAAATVLAAITSTIRSVVPIPVLAVPSAPQTIWVAPHLPRDVVTGGVGVRGPPVGSW
ncbi:YtxH domain-containing protein [Gordonia sp. CPCC 206044]|uniref:YtxH domain-containing protein n=1 Tax=Gordonia sp. CPCC 206044 TaxID=3140793 RepID=UPI003AF368BA